MQGLNPAPIRAHIGHAAQIDQIAIRAFDLHGGLQTAHRVGFHSKHRGVANATPDRPAGAVDLGRDGGDARTRGKSGGDPTASASVRRVERRLPLRVALLGAFQHECRIQRQNAAELIFTQGGMASQTVAERLQFHGFDAGRAGRVGQNARAGNATHHVAIPARRVIAAYLLQGVGLRFRGRCINDGTGVHRAARENR